MTAQFRGILLGSAFAHFALAVTGAFFVAHLPFPKNEVSPVAVEIEVPQAAEPAPAFPPLPEVVKGELLSLPAVAHHEPRPITKAVRRLEVARSLRPVPAKSSSRRSKSEHAPSVPVSRHSDAGSVRASVQTPVHAAALPAASAGFPAGVPATASGDAPPRARIASAPAVPPSAGSGPAISHPAPVPVARKSPAIGRDYFVELIRVISAHRSYPRASLDNEEE
ncbi:MAG: hypothetical protein EBX52_01385, partial [Proteobacteria bacterium]|nr:hypothetical protein [Pseudomonadota bacterium]